MLRARGNMTKTIILLAVQSYSLAIAHREIKLEIARGYIVTFVTSIMKKKANPCLFVL